MGIQKTYWTKEEESFLRKHYPKCKSVEWLANKLGRSVYIIYNKASFMNLSRRSLPAYNRVHFSKREEVFIKENFHSMTNPQLAKRLGKTLTVVRNKCREMGLLHMKLEYWTKEQIQFLRENYKEIGDSELADIFNKKWKKQKGWTNKHIEKKRRYLKLKRSVEQQFLIRTGRFKAADYKNFNGKNFTAGAKRLWMSNGKWYWMIKVGNKFIKYHRYRWEKFRGKIPKGMKLVFLDGNTLNVKLSNLAIMSQQDLAGRVAKKLHSELSDRYIAGVLSHGWHSKSNKDLKKHLLNNPELLEAKRLSILLNRQTKKQ